MSDAEAEGKILVELAELRADVKVIQHGLSILVDEQVTKARAAATERTARLGEAPPPAESEIEAMVRRVAIVVAKTAAVEVPIPRAQEMVLALLMALRQEGYELQRRKP